MRTQPSAPNPVPNVTRGANWCAAQARMSASGCPSSSAAHSSVRLSVVILPRCRSLLLACWYKEKRPGSSLEHPGPLGPLRLLACWPPVIGAVAPHVNASVPPTQEPQGLARNNNNSRTRPCDSRPELYPQRGDQSSDPSGPTAGPQLTRRQDRSPISGSFCGEPPEEAAL